MSTRRVLLSFSCVVATACTYGGRISAGESVTTTGAWATELTGTVHAGMGGIYNRRHPPESNAAFELSLTGGVRLTPGELADKLALFGLEYLWVPEDAARPWGYRFSLDSGVRFNRNGDAYLARVTGGVVFRIVDREEIYREPLQLFGIDLKLGLDHDFERSGGAALSVGVALTVALARMGHMEL